MSLEQSFFFFNVIFYQSFTCLIILESNNYVKLSPLGPMISVTPMAGGRERANDSADVSLAFLLGSSSNIAVKSHKSLRLKF